MRSVCVSFPRLHYNQCAAKLLRLAKARRPGIANMSSGIKAYSESSKDVSRNILAYVSNGYPCTKVTEVYRNLSHTFKCEAVQDSFNFNARGGYTLN
jgi:hypothetical protein